MKKIILYAAAVSAMFACNKAEVDVQAPVEAPEVETVWVEFTAGVETKVAINEGEGTSRYITWENNDKVMINGQEFAVTETKDDGRKATFGANVPVNFTKTTEYNAVYPASAVKNGKITVDGTAGVDGIVAVAKSTDMSLQFKHVTSLIKFQVPSDFKVTTVTISANDELTGDVAVSMTAEDKAPTFEVSNSANIVTLNGTFTADTDYYVPVLPGTKKNLTVRFNGYYSKSWDSATLGQGGVVYMKDLPAPEKFTWGIVGKHQEWDIKNPTPMYKVTDNVYAVLDITLKHNGFKFAKHGLQNWNTANTSFGAWKDFPEPYVLTDWYQVYTDNLGDQNKNLGVSDWSKKYDVYVKVMTDADWGQELKYNVVVAGSKVTFPQ